MLVGSLGTQMLLFIVCIHNFTHDLKVSGINKESSLFLHSHMTYFSTHEESWPPLSTCFSFVANKMFPSNGNFWSSKRKKMFQADRRSRFNIIVAPTPPHAFHDIKWQTSYSYMSSRHNLKNDSVMNSKVFNHCLQLSALQDPKAAGKLLYVVGQGNSLQYLTLLYNCTLVSSWYQKSQRTGCTSHVYFQRRIWVSSHKTSLSLGIYSTV